MEKDPEENQLDTNTDDNDDNEDVKNGEEAKNSENEFFKKYKLTGVKIQRKVNFNDELFKENVTNKWFNKESFLKTMKKKNYF